LECANFLWQISSNVPPIIDAAPDIVGVAQRKSRTPSIGKDGSNSPKASSD
jgi:hypothetical protein